jgi:hypothetical protein
MHEFPPIRGLSSRSLRKYRVQQQRDVLPEGFKIGRDVLKDNRLEEKNHVTEFQVSKINNVGRTEPILDARRMIANSSSTIEGRVPYSIVGTPEMGADEKEDIEERF